ncbi:hypothetical protein PHYSODRAFT_292893 [Phytophthora sojae]|uniref:Uncharacterized protein n=1 Tax=Phytophthora sojae (strain P6497) TaxID=1094619 RepID=G4YHZ4_PHYSP|nr:hypothetical protein PHYSODRAFT_292893 [Phytophthora sojae]EGZ26581.1 hypothetical protein PHYSODRAFT_292893 [Phytophthora sojae]|eukprot:XP_009513856.1 hypothetical protein PHYSODRAFT_292893 [Phytophthora sojae]
MMIPQYWDVQLARFVRQALDHWPEVIYMLVFMSTCAAVWGLGGRITSTNEDEDIDADYRKIVGVLRDVLFLAQPVVYAQLPLRLNEAVRPRRAQVVFILNQPAEY